jgi:Ca-activated chloride channel family protein
MIRSSRTGGPALGTTVVVLLLNALLCGQQLQQFKSRVRLINVVATVVDGKGRSVPNLTIDDFILYEDDQPQTITYLEPAAHLPISLGVILDTSGSMAGGNKIRTAQRAIDTFLLMLNQDDEIFLMTFARQPKIIAEFTSDRTRLSNALWTGVNVTGSTSLYDSLHQGLQHVNQGRHEKKAVLLITDGEDNTSMTRPDKALQNIREADMLVYSIGIKGTPVFDMGTNRPSGNFGSRLPTVDMKVLRQFGAVSGGWAEEISESTFGDKMDFFLGKIAAELRSQYSISYYPNRPTGDGKMHYIRIRMKNPDYFVRGRSEYVDDAPAPVAAPTAGRYAGRPLEDVLVALGSRGLKILSSSDLVKPEMRVESEPTSTDPRKILDEVLKPHGLRAVPAVSKKDALQVVRAR